MVNDHLNNKRVVILDTNVLLHDPSSLFRFPNDDIFLPMMVLEELDNNKRGNSEIARNARQASRFLEELLRHTSRHQIETGLPLPTVNNGKNGHSGRIFFQTRSLSYSLPNSLPGHVPDNTAQIVFSSPSQHLLTSAR